MTEKTVLIMVDLQNDFCEGGSLGASDTTSLIPLINRLQPHFDLVVASQDWHPANHSCFVSHYPDHKVGDVIQLEEVSQILWPEHCVQHSFGAAFHSDLDISKIDKIIHKGTDVKIHSYSTFFDDAHLHTTELENYLRDQQAEHVYVVGIATDYCVKFSVLDALTLGFKVTVIEDACRGIELQKGDIEAALAEMRAAGASIIHSSAII